MRGFIPGISIEDISKKDSFPVISMTDMIGFSIKEDIKREVGNNRGKCNENFEEN